VTFRERLLNRGLIIGAFVKTPSPIIIEVLGLTGLDCLCIDAEHAPFDRLAIDSCLMAARAAGVPAFVRTASSAPEHILNALDCGAAGVVLPHIRSAEEARAAATAARYGAGGRGYAGSTRAAEYTMRPMATHLAASASDTIVVAQIEDIEAVEAIDAIAAVPGIDALFIGRVDLTVAMEADSQDNPRVVSAVETVCRAAAGEGRTVGMFLSRPSDVPEWRAKGASFFLLGSDHGFILSGAAEMLKQTGRD
jgi:2-keto-3-deoxy-L-rhamnonate aldolase RhmA